jgi:6,7-dimethyl-8-ribityllumazine synthase
MSSSGGFWPGEAPDASDEIGEENDFAVTEPAPELEATQAWHMPEAEEELEAEVEAEAVAEPELAPEPVAEPELAPEPVAEPAPVAEPEPIRAHRPGEIDVPAGVAVIEGAPFGSGRSVGIVVARFNSEISNGLLDSALEALAAAGVDRARITVMPVPGAFELPIGAMALAKSRRYSAVIGLGCVIRGETAHFEYVASEAASGLQLAGLETGVPVTFGVLTVDTLEQAQARLDKGGEAARAALEMADIFAQVRAQVRAAG